MRLLRDLPTGYLHRDVVIFVSPLTDLAPLVEQQMDLDPFAYAWYVFCNSPPRRLKVLYGDPTGFCSCTAPGEGKVKWRASIRMAVNRCIRSEFKLAT